MRSENLSDEKENAFFDGMQDDILSSLTKIAELKVTSYTSVMQYRLIDARNDQHVWAERFDRTMVDSIGLQGELATEIAKVLRGEFQNSDAGGALLPRRRPLGAEAAKQPPLVSDGERLDRSLDDREVTVTPNDRLGAQMSPRSRAGRRAPGCRIMP